MAHYQNMKNKPFFSMVRQPSSLDVMTLDLHIFKGCFNEYGYHAIPKQLRLASQMSLPTLRHSSSEAQFFLISISSFSTHHSFAVTVSYPELHLYPDMSPKTECSNRRACKNTLIYYFRYLNLNDF